MFVTGPLNVRMTNMNPLLFKITLLISFQPEAMEQWERLAYLERTSIEQIIHSELLCRLRKFGSKAIKVERMKPDERDK